MQVESQRDLILWTIREYKEQLLSKGESGTMESDEKGAAGSLGESSSSGACRTAAEIEKAEKEDRARMAAERRAQIMAQMASAQKNFMTTNADLFASTSTTTQDKNEQMMEWQEEPGEDQKLVCLGPNRKHRFVEDQLFTCILCSEDAAVTKNGKCMVYSAFIQKSNILTHKSDPTPAPHSSSCGHVMHATCWKEYFNNEVMKENRRPNRNRSQGNFTTDKKEFLCPLCRCLSNAVIPIIPSLSRIGPKSTNQNVSDTESTDNVPAINFEKWILFMRNYNWALQQITDLPELNSENTDILAKLPDLNLIVNEVCSMEEFDKLAQPTERDLVSPEMKYFIEEFTNSVKRAAPFLSVDNQAEPHLVTWISCSYTIQALEMYLRALNKPLKGQMSIRQTSCLSGLVRVSGLLATTLNDDIVAKLLTQLRSQLNTMFSNAGSCFIEWDLFKMLITFIFITPSVLFAKNRDCSIPNGTLLEYYLLKMIFLAVITKIVVLHKYEEKIENDADEPAKMDVDEHKQDASDETSSSEKVTSLVEFYNKFNFHARDLKDSGTDISTKSQVELKESIINAIKSESKVFLRCCCLLFQFLTDIDLPDDLFDSDGDTFETMCEYLGLDTDLETYFKCDSTSTFMSNLASHPDVEKYRTIERSSLKDQLVPCVTPVRKLIDLPTDYSDLINSVSTFTCPHNDRDDSRNPTMCLVCGVTLCSMTYCCQRDLDGSTVGACTYHANECGAGVGIFLRIRECEILLLGLNKGCFVSSPYLDKYGETDQGLRRGNPLTLCPERYAKLNLLWLSHSLHEDIARSAEAINNVIPTQWQHL